MPDAEPPIRVCLVVSHFFPQQSGAERQALEQGAELVRLGHEVHVVTKRVPGLPDDEEVRGIRVHRWVATSSAGPLFGASFVAGVVRALSRLRPRFDLVHTHQALWEAVATGVARPWLKGAPTLVQPASSGYYGEAEELMRTKGASILRRIILRNTAFAAISADIERQWLGLGVPADRIVRMASGVDAERYRPGPSAVEADLPPRPRVVFTGRLHPQKNLDVLLDAWPEVARRTRASLVLVGDGPERERLRGKAEALGIGGRVRFVGAMADAAEHLRAADAFVLPSVAEGMSNSLLEAMATGLPCLASAIGGNTDLIDDGRTGRLIPADDAASWSDGLVEVLSDPDLSRRLGDAARARVEAEYALPVVVRRYVGLYRRLLSGSGTR
jgi:glycosyltransferase involved in cell wall biosynthesis